LLSEIEARLQALDELARAEHAAELGELNALQVGIDGISREITAIAQQITLQRTRQLALTRDISDLEQLAEAGLLPRQHVRARTDELMLVEAIIQRLEREQVGLEAQALELHARRTLISSASERELAILRSQAAELRQQITEIRLRTGTAVRAPADGTVTAIATQEGEIVAAGIRLSAIIPKGAALEARVFLPTRAAGFIEQGQEVSLRFAAFPYQRFGVQRGRVRSVPSVLASDRDLPRTISTMGPVYELRVELSAQGISTAQGISRLRPGMELEADILLERRALIRWLLEPLEALMGASP
jgi:membrane fusion protein